MFDLDGKFHFQRVFKSFLHEGMEFWCALKLSNCSKPKGQKQRQGRVF